jgi:hypothetical protein
MNFDLSVEEINNPKLKGNNFEQRLGKEKPKNESPSVCFWPAENHNRQQQ